jgi:hypothetical protein
MSKMDGGTYRNRHCLAEDGEIDILHKFLEFYLSAEFDNPIGRDAEIGRGIPSISGHKGDCADKTG